MPSGERVRQPSRRADATGAYLPAVLSRPPPAPLSRLRAPAARPARVEPARKASPPRQPDVPAAWLLAPPGCTTRLYLASRRCRPSRSVRRSCQLLRSRRLGQAEDRVDEIPPTTNRPSPRTRVRA